MDYPAELDAVAAAAPGNTPEARVEASGVPYLDWSWDAAPFETESETRRVAEVLRAWSRPEVEPEVCGVLLYGDAGLGKTGIACSVVRSAAEAAVGSPAHWFYVTGAKVREAVAGGDFRRRPAPAYFARWCDLKSLLDRAKSDRTPWVETPPLTAEKVLGEVEERCWVLALDDVDVDHLTPWKEEVLLRLLDLPLRRRRLVVTMNVDPEGPAGLQRLGERVVDRLMDSSLFAQFHLTGDSLRRRRA